MNLEENKKQIYKEKFTSKIIQILMYEHNLSEEEAKSLLNDSIYYEMLDEDFALVMHYPPKYWADKALKFRKDVVFAY